MQNNSDISNSTSVKPERSPIITVLFFFGIVMNIVSAIMTTTDYYTYDTIEYEPFLLVVCQDIINIVSLTLLLYWKPLGFYLYAINTLIAYIVLVTLTGAEYDLFDNHNGIRFHGEAEFAAVGAEQLSVSDSAAVSSVCSTWKSYKNV